MSEHKTVGIIGGMGPLATADLFTKIIRHTRASCDAEHLHIVIDNNTAIPDRTAAILHGGEDPLPQLVKSAERLERAGADFLIMPCNTAHHYYDALCAKTPLPVLNMIELAAREAAARGKKCVGLLSTDGTIAARIYDGPFEKAGVALVRALPQGQRAIMSMIYDDIKGGRDCTDRAEICAVLDDMCARGAECFVLGCTEMPLAFTKYALPYEAVDATDVLARAAVTFAGGELV